MFMIKKILLVWGFKTLSLPPPHLGQPPKKRYPQARRSPRKKTLIPSKPFTRFRIKFRSNFDSLSMQNKFKLKTCSIFLMIKVFGLCCFQLTKRKAYKNLPKSRNNRKCPTNLYFLRQKMSM